MNCEGALNAFEFGFASTKQEQLQEQKKTRNKKSKLEAEGTEVKRLWTEGKSMGFIRNRLKEKGISCARSTVWRYLQKALSL